MRIPKKLKIGGFDYEVILVNLLNDLGSMNAGKCYQPAQKIWIDNDCTQHQKEETLLHEIIESILSCNGIDVEHSIISTLSNNLYQVLKDNDLLK